VKAALLVAMVVILGSCHDAPPSAVAPVIETKGPVIPDEPAAFRQGGAADYPTDTPIAMP